jgi:hypothetical protein
MKPRKGRERKGKEMRSVINVKWSGQKRRVMALYGVSFAALKSN